MKLNLLELYKQYQNIGVSSSLDVVAVRSILFSFVSVFTYLPMLCVVTYLRAAFPECSANPDWMVIAECLDWSGTRTAPL